MVLLALTLGGCAGSDAATNVVANRDKEVSIDNFAVDADLPWAYVTPDLKFDGRSAAERLPHPNGLRAAQFGYFSELAITRQYSAQQLAQMLRDHAGFVLSRDLDGDNVAETYRTGFWRRPDGTEGSFLAVFDRGRAPQLIDSTSEGRTGIFLSGSRALVVADCNCSHAGRVGYREKRLTVMWSED